MSNPIGTNHDRLWNSLMAMAEIGATANGGVCRISFTPEDEQARDLFVDWCKQANLDIRVDVFGNIFARRWGRNPGLNPVLIGSHLDSQPTGGRFDGVYGVLSGLEVIRTLIDQNIETERSIEVVNWTNEEGAIFKPMIGSEVFIGALDLEQAYAMKDPDGNTLEQGLDRIGYKGETGLRPYPVYGYFESHIEQGPILENDAVTVGVVTGAVAQRWFEITLTGLEAHAGPTPMKGRRDAFMGAAEIALAARELALGIEGARATVGWVRLHPASPNVIPGRAEMNIDLRHADESVLSKLAADLQAVIREKAAANGLEIDIRQTVHIAQVPFHKTLVRYVRKAAQALDLSHKDIVSGAGHDACNMAKIVPTTMIFIPCENGISHNEAENATPVDCGAGCDVLLNAVIAASNNLEELEMPS